MPDNVAEAASAMAFRLWNEEHGREPKTSDCADFLELVAACVKALSGGKSSYSLANL